MISIDVWQFSCLFWPRWSDYCCWLKQSGQHIRLIYSAILKCPWARHDCCIHSLFFRSLHAALSEKNKKNKTHIGQLVCKVRGIGNIFHYTKKDLEESADLFWKMGCITASYITIKSSMQLIHLVISNREVKIWPLGLLVCWTEQISMKPSEGLRYGPSGPSYHVRFNHNTNDLNKAILHRGYSCNVNLTGTVPKSDVCLFGHRFKTTEETYRLSIRYWIPVNLATQWW